MGQTTRTCWGLEVWAVNRFDGCATLLNTKRPGRTTSNIRFGTPVPAADESLPSEHLLCTV